MPHPSLPLIIVAFLLLLGPLIVLHELGHYLVGRLFGVGVRAFSVGFGRELAGFTDRRGTRWKLSLVPLGGYVQFAGDMSPAGRVDPDAPVRPDDFQTRPLWQRALIVLAGPVANLLVALAILTAFNLADGRSFAAPVIAGFTQGSTAEAAGLRLGDRITAIDGHAIDSFNQIPDRILPYPGETVKVEALRRGAPISFAVPIATKLETDPFGHTSRIGLIGIAAGAVQREALGPVAAVDAAVRETGERLAMIVTGIGQMFTGERSVRELGGVVRIAQYSGATMALGWHAFAGFAAFVSINLAFINLLPIPVLDGGHLAFYAAEAVQGRPVSARGAEWAFRIGFALIAALMLNAMVNDLAGTRWFGG